MTISTVGPVPQSRVWSGTKVLAEDLVGEDIADVLDLHSGASAWWVLDRTTDFARDELNRLATALGLDHLAVIDLTAADRRAKFEEIGQARLVATNAVSLDRDAVELTVSPVSMLLTERVLVCLADPTSSVNPARLLAESRDRIADHGLDSALQTVLKALLDGYEDVVDWLEATTDELSDVLFSERPLSRSEQLRAYRLRRVLSDLRRVTEPMRAVVADLADHAASLDQATGRRWRLLAEKHQRTADAADALREALSSMFETSLALADVQLNTIMKKLTGWAAIIAVPTLVTSFVGMNVGFPLAGSVAGFWLYLVIMVVSGVVLWGIFRRRSWV